MLIFHYSLAVPIQRRPEDCVNTKCDTPEQMQRCACAVLAHSFATKNTEVSSQPALNESKNVMGCHGADCIDSTSAGKDITNDNVSSINKGSHGAAGKGQMKHQGKGGSVTKEHDRMEQLNVPKVSSQAHKSSSQGIPNSNQSDNLFANSGSGISEFGRGTFGTGLQHGLGSELFGQLIQNGSCVGGGGSGGAFSTGIGQGSSSSGGGGPRINCWSCRRGDVRCNARCITNYSAHHF